MDFKKIIDGEEYDFLRENERLKGKIILLALGGSHAYGTQKADGSSDIDIRGIVEESSKDLLGFGTFEQYEDNGTDTVLYGFNKMVNLLLNSNPNTIEILGCKPEHYLEVSDIGQELLSNRKLFLSQRCISSFGGYAYQQLTRLENGLSRTGVSPEVREEQLRRSCNKAMLNFNKKYAEYKKGHLGVYGKSIDGVPKVCMDINYTGVDIREMNGMLNDLRVIVKTHDKLRQSTTTKGMSKMNKHAMHLVRLYMMCIDILEKEEIKTYREDDLELLSSIRNGEYMLEDGSYRKDFFEMVENFKGRLEYAKEHTNLPKSPDIAKVEEFVMDTNSKIIAKEKKIWK